MGSSDMDAEADASKGRFSISGGGLDTIGLLILSIVFLIGLFLILDFTQNNANLTGKILFGFIAPIFITK